MRNISLLCTVAALALATSPTPGATAAAADAGKALFEQECARCHSTTGSESGEDDDAPGLANLFKNKTLPRSGRPATEANVRAQILNGGGGMPPFKDALSGAQVDALIAYLKTL